MFQYEARIKIALYTSLVFKEFSDFLDVAHIRGSYKRFVLKELSDFNVLDVARIRGSYTRLVFKELNKVLNCKVRPTLPSGNLNKPTFPTKQGAQQYSYAHTPIKHNVL